MSEPSGRTSVSPVQRPAADPLSRPPTLSGLPRDLAEIFGQLDRLYSGMAYCLEGDASAVAGGQVCRTDRDDGDLAQVCGARPEPRTIAALLQQQRSLLVELERAIGAALASGVVPERLEAVIGHVEAGHRHCQGLLRRRLAELERALAGLSKRRVQRAAYLAHSGDAAKTAPL